MDIGVDTGALAAAAGDLATITSQVHLAVMALERSGTDAMFAVPADSDLGSAYLFAWGRWAAAAHAVHADLEGLVVGVHRAAGGYEQAELSCTVPAGSQDRPC